MSEEIKQTAEERRPPREIATAMIESLLLGALGEIPDYELHPEGDADSAEGKCCWKFWVAGCESTSYLHENLTFEWYGTSAPTYEERRLRRALELVSRDRYGGEMADHMIEVWLIRAENDLENDLEGKP